MPKDNEVNDIIPNSFARFQTKDYEEQITTASRNNRKYAEDNYFTLSREPVGQMYPEPAPLMGSLN